MQVRLKLIKKLDRYTWRPARWWCPERAYFRLWPFLLSVPRQWWPHKKDGVHRCANCGRESFIVDYGQFTWCRECARLSRQLQGFLSAPSWWIDRARRRAIAAGLWD